MLMSVTFIGSEWQRYVTLTMLAITTVYTIQHELCQSIVLLCLSKPYIVNKISLAHIATVQVQVQVFILVPQA